MSQLTSGPVRLACRWRLARGRRGWAPEISCGKTTRCRAPGCRKTKSKKKLSQKHWNAPKQKRIPAPWFPRFATKCMGKVGGEASHAGSKILRGERWKKINFFFCSKKPKHRTSISLVRATQERGVTAELFRATANLLLILKWALLSSQGSLVKYSIVSFRLKRKATQTFGVLEDFLGVGEIFQMPHCLIAVLSFCYNFSHGQIL